MSSGETARPAPDVKGLLRTWMDAQTTGLLSADDFKLSALQVQLLHFQGVSDSHLVEARWQQRLKAGTQEIKQIASPPRGHGGEAVRSNRFVRGAPPGPSRARLEIARRRREASLLCEMYERAELHKYKLGPSALPAASPARPSAGEYPFTSISRAHAEIAPAPRRPFERMHRVTAHDRTRTPFRCGVTQHAAPADSRRQQYHIGPSVGPTRSRGPMYKMAQGPGQGPACTSTL